MSEWTEESLGRLASIEIGGTPSRDVPAFWASENAEGFPWASIADLGPRFVSATKERITRLGVLSSNVKPVKSGTLMMSFKLTIGRAGIAACDLFTNEAIAAFVPAPQTLDGNFLYYLLPPIARNAVTDVAIKGSTLNKQTLSKLKLRFPKDMRQQRRIAEILSTLDEAIEQTEALIAKHQQIKAGLIHDLFTRGVTPDGHLRPTREQAPDLYEESPLGWIPKEWEITPLLSFSTSRPGGFVNGPFGSDLLTSELTDSGVVVIYVQDIKDDGYIRVSTAYVTEEKANELLVCNVRLGDVLVAKVGDPPGIAAAYAEEQRAVVTQDVIRIRPADDVVTQFLVGLLNSTVGSRAIRRITIEGTRARVSLTEFKCLLLPKPTSKEQQMIADKITVAQQVLSAFTFELRKMKTQKHGLMHDLLTGHVRVQEDAQNTEISP